MLEFLMQLKAIDSELFFFINQTLANPVTDMFMPFVTGDTNLRIFYAACLFLILWKGDTKLRLAVIFSLVTVSSHAANLFGQAFFFRKVAPFTGKYLIPLAIVVALSRVFVGVHYPADILVGSALGTLVGLGVSYGFLHYLPSMQKFIRSKWGNENGP